MSDFRKNDFTQENTLRLIPGLGYREAFITPEEEAVLIEAIDSQEWLGDLARRVQHYGYKYDYKARRIDMSMRIGNLPGWVSFLVERLLRESIFKTPPDQLIINEYLPGQGIAPHVDCESCFTDTITSISLCSGTVMHFSKDAIQIPVVLQARSLVTMRGASRSVWKHGIAARKTDEIDGQQVKRQRRISLTFRQVIVA